MYSSRIFSGPRVFHFGSIASSYGFRELHMARSTTSQAGVYAGSTPRQARTRLPVGVGLAVAATLSGLLWLPALMAAHALLA
jgi:hypothetical protein